MASGSQVSAEAAAARHQYDIDLELKPRWDDGATTYLIRFDLPGFKKDEFKVLVDAGGRLTLRGQRPSGHVRVNKALQLPPTADVNRIAARFDGSVLCLTVPKVPVGVAEMALARMDEAKEAAAWETETEKGRSEWGRGQVIAAAVAAFALGVVVTHKFLSAKYVETHGSWQIMEQLKPSLMPTSHRAYVYAQVKRKLVTTMYSCDGA